jgi:hypothetical protein
MTMLERSSLRVLVCSAAAALAAAIVFSCQDKAGIVKPEPLSVGIECTTPAAGLLVGDTIKFSLSLSSTTQMDSAVFSFGDGSTKSLTVQSFGTTGRVVLSHVFAAAGAYSAVAVVHLSDGTDKTAVLSALSISCKRGATIVTSDLSFSVSDVPRLQDSLAALGMNALYALLQGNNPGLSLDGQIDPLSIKTTDTDIYFTIVRSSCASDTTRLIKVHVITIPQIPPVITVPPSPVSVSVGDYTGFWVSVNASPKPTYQWMKNGLPIAGATESYLSIDSVAFSDTGAYSVKVKNTLDSVTSAPARLTVIPSLSDFVLTHHEMSGWDTLAGTNDLYDSIVYFNQFSLLELVDGGDYSYCGSCYGDGPLRGGVHYNLHNAAKQTKISIFVMNYGSTADALAEFSARSSSLLSANPKAALPSFSESVAVGATFGAGIQAVAHFGPFFFEVQFSGYDPASGAVTDANSLLTIMQSKAK